MVHPGCLLISTILNTRSMVCVVCVGVLVSSSSSYHHVLAPSGICVFVSLLPRAFLPSLPRFSFPRVLVPLNPRVLVVFVFQVNKSFPSLVFPLLFSEPRICFRRRKRVLLQAPYL